MLNKIVLDLETQKSFQEVGGRGKNHLLKVSVCGIYDYAKDKYLVYEEAELPKLSEVLQTADQIIGFNNRSFDSVVLQPYLNFNIFDIPHLDLLEEIEKVFGKRLSLETVAQGTLGKGKIGKGLDAITYFRNGQMNELKKYCQEDVKITKQIYEYALKNGKLLYKDFFNVKEIPMRLTEAIERSNKQRQPVLF